MSLLAVVMIVLGSVGCGMGQAREVGVMGGLGIDEPLAHQSEDRFGADASRLAVDIPRTLKRIGWGRLRTEVGPGVDGSEELVRASALAPSGQRAVIIGRPGEDGHVQVTIRVGHFGNPRLERVFLQELQKAMANDPLPKRDWDFEMPD